MRLKDQLDPYDPFLIKKMLNRYLIFEKKIIRVYGYC